MIVKIPNPWRFSTAEQREQQSQQPSPKLRQLLEIVRRQNLLRGLNPGSGKVDQDDQL
jgi:hypothetical protein